MYLDKESKGDHREAKQKMFALLLQWITAFGCANLLIYPSLKDYISRATSLPWLKGVTGQWTVNLPFTTVRPKKCSSLIPRCSSTRLKTSWPVDLGWSKWRNRSIHSQQKDCSTAETWLEEGQGSRAVSRQALTPTVTSSWSLLGRRTQIVLSCFTEVDITPGVWWRWVLFLCPVLQMLFSSSILLLSITHLK